jgi:RNA-directed DNA polymerase
MKAPRGAFCNLVGGVVSPLLANIALHGLESALGVRYRNRGGINGPRAVVRYADDFVVFCESKEDTEAARQDVKDWLATRGLRLSEAKTRIVHLTEGFDFLGFNIRHYRAPKTAKSGYKLLTKPSKASVQKLKARLKQEWMALKGHGIIAVLKRLNPILRGWANYFRIGVSKKAFKSIDHWMFKRCVRYVKSTHPTKSWKWWRSKYWGKLNRQSNDQWVFGDRSTGRYLLKLSWTPIRRHVLVKGASSPDDPTLKEYWIRRQERKVHDLPSRLTSLARSQKGLCIHCGTSLYNGEELHTHHHRPKSEGGTSARKNLRLVHLFCHQQTHRARVMTEDAK